MARTLVRVDRLEAMWICRLSKDILLLGVLSDSFSLDALPSCHVPITSDSVFSGRLYTSLARTLDRFNIYYECYGLYVFTIDMVTLLLSFSRSKPLHIQSLVRPSHHQVLYVWSGKGFGCPRHTDRRSSAPNPNFSVISTSGSLGAAPFVPGPSWLLGPPRCRAKLQLLPLSR